MLANDEQFEEGYNHFDNYIHNLATEKQEDDEMTMKEYNDLKDEGMTGAEAMNALMIQEAETNKTPAESCYLAKYRMPHPNSNESWNCIDFYKNGTGEIVKHAYVFGVAKTAENNDFSVVETIPSLIEGYISIGLREQHGT